MLVRVKTFPSSAKEEVIELRKDSFRVFVREDPKEGMATEAVKRALAKHFRIPVSKIKLVRGGKERSKVFEIGE